MVAAFRPVVSKDYGGNKEVESDPCLSISHFHALGAQGQELSFDIVTTLVRQVWHSSLGREEPSFWLGVDTACLACHDVKSCPDKAG